MKRAITALLIAALVLSFAAPVAQALFWWEKEHPCIENFAKRTDLAARARGENFNVSVTLVLEGKFSKKFMKATIRLMDSGGNVLEAQKASLSLTQGGADISKDPGALDQLKSGDTLYVCAKPKGMAEETFTLKLYTATKDALPYYRKMLAENVRLIYSLGIPEKSPSEDYTTDYGEDWYMEFYPVVAKDMEESGYCFEYMRDTPFMLDSYECTTMTATVRQKELPARPLRIPTPQENMPADTDALNARLKKNVLQRNRIDVDTTFAYGGPTSETFDGDDAPIRVVLTQMQSRESVADKDWKIEDGELLFGNYDWPFTYTAYMDGKKIASGKSKTVEYDTSVTIKIPAAKLEKAKTISIKAKCKVEGKTNNYSIVIDLDKARAQEDRAGYSLYGYAEYLAQFNDWTVKSVYYAEGIDDQSMRRIYERPGVILTYYYSGMGF